MPFPVPVTTMTPQFQSFGGGSIAATGYLFISNGPVDIVLHYGNAAGQAQSIQYPNVSAGQYLFQGSAKYGIVGIDVRAAGGIVSTPAAQQIQGNFVEPSIPSIVPVAGGVTLPNIASINIQHNDALVAAQPTIDFGDGTAYTFSVVNDGAGTRVKVGIVINGITPAQLASTVMQGFRIMSGNFSTGAMTANSKNAFSVVFPTAFGSSLSAVLLTPVTPGDISADTGANIPSAAAYCYAQSLTGFSCDVMNGGNSIYTFTINWLAIGI